MTTKPHDICVALRNWRMRARLRQKAVAQCLGVAQSQVSRWESGREMPRPHNIDAITRMIWGPEGDPLLALRHFVTHSNQHLLLLDAQRQVIAKAKPFQSATSPLDRFGWVLAPDRNPAFEPIQRRYEKMMSAPEGIVGCAVEVPFQIEHTPWAASLRLTVHAIAGIRVCLAELTFQPVTEAAKDIRFEEIRLSGDGGSRTSLTLWPQPLT